MDAVFLPTRADCLGTFALIVLIERNQSLLWRLLVVGDGGENERLQRLAVPNKSRVTFTGHQADRWPY